MLLPKPHPRWLEPWYGWDDGVRRSGRRRAHVTGKAVAGGWTVLLRLAYLGVTNVFALLRLLPVSSRDKDAEILARHHPVDGIGRPRGGRAPACSVGVTTARSEKSNKLSERTRSDLAPSVIRYRGGRGPGRGDSPASRITRTSNHANRVIAAHTSGRDVSSGRTAGTPCCGLGLAGSPGPPRRRNRPERTGRLTAAKWATPRLPGRSAA